MRPTIRFEVFKRDGFRCGYCGRKVPDVVLEVDHVLAVSRGGTDELDNLVTSCVDCNRGKSDRPLKQALPSVDIAARTAELAEREQQLLEYTRLKLRLKDRENFQVREICDGFADLPGASFQRDGETRWFLQEDSVRTFIQRLGLVGAEEALAATKAATGRWANEAPELRALQTWRYFCGCAWRLIRDPR